MHMAMVLTMLGSGGASHRLLSCYVASLLAAKSRSSRHAQIASLIARSSLFAYANNSFRSSAHWPISSGLWPSATLMSWNLHPLRSTLIDVCLHKHQWRRSMPGSSSIACALSITNAWRCILVPHSKNPLTKFQRKIPKGDSNKKFHQEIPTYWKMVSYPHVLYYY